MASGSNAPFSGEYNDLENIPTLPEGVTTEEALLPNSIIDPRFQVDSSSFQSSLDISSEDTIPNSCYFADSEEKFYLMGSDTDTIYEYTGRVRDVSSATVSHSKSISNIGFLRGITFRNGGKVMFLIDADGKIVKYILGTAFDLSTASRDTSNTFPTSAKPKGIKFDSNADRVFIPLNGGDIEEYSLSDTLDISNPSLNTTYSTPNISELWGMDFGDEGNILYLLDEGNNEVEQFKLSTPFDLSTRTSQVVLDVSNQATYPRGIDMSENGTYLLISDYDTQTLYGYEMVNN